LKICFVDTSALAKLYHQEPGSDYMERLFERQTEYRLIVSPLTLIEMESVLAIKMRTKNLDQMGRQTAQDRVGADLRERRILVSPRFDNTHFEFARTCVAMHAPKKEFEPSTPFSWRWLFIYRTPGCSTSLLLPIGRFAAWRDFTNSQPSIPNRSSPSKPPASESRYSTA
jgi:uncharacterized protein with PIN domain